MLIIPQKSWDWGKHISLAANTEAWESFSIRPVEDNFQLSLYKVADSKLEKWYPIAVLNTQEQCEKLFQAIVTAIASGDKVFRVSNYFDQNALKRDDLPTV